MSRISEKLAKMSCENMIYSYLIQFLSEIHKLVNAVVLKMLPVAYPTVIINHMHAIILNLS